MPLELGRTIRWRSQRWRVTGLEDGFAELVGIDAANDGAVTSPLLALEAHEFQPDVPGDLSLEVAGTSRPRWRAMHQAYMATMVGGRERLAGLDWGAIAVEPYQLVPLMRAARHASPRLLLADDTGLGKTAEAGLVLRYLTQRHRAARVLVVTRAAPDPGRWQRELWLKFGMRFDILRDGTDFVARRRANPTTNVFAQSPRLIASMTLLSRQVFLDELRQGPAYDVVIVDEAHNVAQRGSGTKRLAVLARELARKTDGGALLLLTATPHDGKSESFLSLLRLLNPYVELRDGRVAASTAARLVVRRLKGEVELSAGGRFIPPEIHVRSTLRNASRAERDLEGPLESYLQYLRSREADLTAADERAKAKGCQFLATTLLKRTGSSVAALRATLRRRLGLPPAAEDEDALVPAVPNDASDPEDDEIDPTAGEVTPPPELDEDEARLAEKLLRCAEEVPEGRDAKLAHLAALLGDELAERKVVVFTEYRDTLRAAASRLTNDGVEFVTFHGGTPTADREEALRRFQHDSSVRVFLATDAGSEGQNLHHRCADLVHLDVPWNPNRYEQRNGRIDRYGQTRRPQIWALVAADRRTGTGRPEFRALEVVLEKLTRIASELGSVGAVLPALSGDRVASLLMRAGAAAERQADELVDEEALGRANEQLNRLTVQNRREIDNAAAVVGQLGTVEDFRERVEALLVPAFRGWGDGGRLEPVEDDVVRVVVPRRLRSLMERDEIPRATFRRAVAIREADEDRADQAELLSPGHPLVEATARALREASMAPRFEDRFDVAADSDPALVLSFLTRFGDGEGRTVEERIEAVAAGIGGDVSDDAAGDLERLALDGQPGDLGPRARPDPAAIAAWQEAYPRLVPAASEEAEQRALGRLSELTDTARSIQEEELEGLALWREDEHQRIESDAIELGPALSFDEAADYERRHAALEEDFSRRRDALREQSTISLTSVDLIGGLLLVSPAP